MTSTKSVEIYGLFDPRDERLRYIGKANNAERRLISHLRDMNRRNTPLYAWMRKLVALEMVPEMQVLDRCAPISWQTEERRQIAIARERGLADLNLADGGDEPFCPPDVRASNGRLVAKLRVRDELHARVYRLNREVGRLRAKGLLTEGQKAKLRYAAAKAPHFFGKWANV